VSHLAPFLRYSDILAENRHFNLPCPYFASPLGVISLEFHGDFWHQNQSPWAIVWHCFCDPQFRRLCRTPTCDGQTDGRTDEQTRDDSIYCANYQTLYKALVLYKLSDWQQDCDFFYKAMQSSASDSFLRFWRYINLFVCMYVYKTWIVISHKQMIKVFTRSPVRVTRMSRRQSCYKMLTTLTMQTMLTTAM